MIPNNPNSGPAGESGDRRAMASTEPSSVGTQLDQHHAPETNGRMAVCRRCGARTDALGQHHLPASHQLTRSGDWLLDQARLSRISEVRTLRQS